MRLVGPWRAMDGAHVCHRNRASTGGQGIPEEVSVSVRYTAWLVLTVHFSFLKVCA